MSTGLFALLDDIAGLAKVAAASLDDAAGQAATLGAQAGAKALGVVIDDTAMTPTFVEGFPASRELPIIARIAAGSLRNKLLYLMPAALLLSAVAPAAITPLLMLGATYLCYEGAEKLWSVVRADAASHAPQTAGPDAPPGVIMPQRSFEDVKVRSAIQTDFVLSAEIMAITLGNVEGQPVWLEAAVLATVGLGITAFVYGIVAIIVKADDVGLVLARQARPATRLFRPSPNHPPSRLDRRLSPLTQAVGRVLVRSMPPVLRTLSALGTFAMLWVGGAIIVHGLDQLGWSAPAHSIERVAAFAGAGAGPAAPAVAWVASACASGLLALAVGAVGIPVHAGTAALAGPLLAPVVAAVRRRRKPRQ